VVKDVGVYCVGVVVSSHITEKETWWGCVRVFEERERIKFFV